ncbi:hypothetical protein ACQP1O_16405 [Nocardia sp. CA-151230]|uniref:hypothetical protein n=1 Tax=Nocardia sp. CA-151230 TaxID=3239982 RepID=UPI003D904A53
MTTTALVVPTPGAGLHPVASPTENQRALGEFAQNMNTGTLAGAVCGIVMAARI